MQKAFNSINPFTASLLTSIPFHTDMQIEQILKNSQEAHQHLKKLPQPIIIKRLEKLSNLIEQNHKEYAALITQEIGKPIQQSIMEVKKSANHCRFYAQNLNKMTSPTKVKTDSLNSFVKLEPLGSILMIQPFNFPFWLAFKAGIPILSLGNSIILRPPDSAPLVGKALQELFINAGFDSNEFQLVFSPVEQTENLIQKTQGVSFTGSSQTGSLIGQLAGKHIKKSCLELGGMDPFIVLEDADVEKAVTIALKSRTANAGQVCISAKRFIVQQRLYEKFVELLERNLKEIKLGDPMDPSTQMGPLSKKSYLETVESQVQTCIKEGGKLRYGGEREIIGQGFFYKPTLIEVQPDNYSFREEIFGPVFCITKFQKNEEAIQIANDNKYGLGATIISRDIDLAQQMARNIESGSVSINEPMRSDTRMPSGGCKNSGYGRECGHYGLEQFANIKSVYISRL